MNSVPSSTIVKSAPVFVSNTLSNPICFNAFTIFPSTFVPIGISNSSPNATLTEGAVCTITYVFLSFILSHTICVESFSLKAPVGHTSIHCPQKVQFTSFKLLCPAVETHELNPLSVTPIAPIFCTLLHIETHLLHNMHLLGSRTIDGDLSSISYMFFVPSYTVLSLSNWFIRSCNSQFSFLTQLSQS